MVTDKRGKLLGAPWARASCSIHLTNRYANNRTEQSQGATRFRGGGYEAILNCNPGPKLAGRTQGTIRPFQFTSSSGQRQGFPGSEAPRVCVLNLGGGNLID